MKTNIVISYKYRKSGLLIETEEFKKELQQHYQIHEKPVWMPAAGGNFEMWFDFFINSPILTFISGAIASGVFYDITKHYIFKPFWDALIKLSNSNNEKLEIQTYRFNFEDITICVYGVNRNHISIFGIIFNEIYKQIPYLLSLENTQNLYEIHMPVNEKNGQLDTWEGPENPKDYINCWRLDTDYGLLHYLFFLEEKKIIEL